MTKGQKVTYAFGNSSGTAMVVSDEDGGYVLIADTTSRIVYRVATSECKVVSTAGPKIPGS